MDQAQAEQVAAAFGKFDSSGGDLSAGQDYEHRVTRALASLLPGLDVWAVVDLRDVPGHDSGAMMLASRGKVLWTSTLREQDGDPRLMARPYEPGDWRLIKVVQTLEHGGGEEKLRRDWHVSLEGEHFAFTTEEPTGPEPNPSQDELLGRALAACKDWEVGDVSRGASTG
jgi:hypothetical protein